MNLSRLKTDIKFIFLNCIVNKIPSWTIRKFLYILMGLKIGRNSRIGLKTVIDHPERIQIGERSIINEYCHIDGRGNVIIGNDCSISVYSKIISATHLANSAEFMYQENPVSIGNNVWIGASAIVLDDTIINDNVIVGAGCVIKGGTESNSIYIGNPAKKIKDRVLEKQYEMEYKPFFR